MKTQLIRTSTEVVIIVPGVSEKFDPKFRLDDGKFCMSDDFIRHVRDASLTTNELPPIFLTKDSFIPQSSALDISRQFKIKEKDEADRNGYNKLLYPIEACRIVDHISRRRAGEMPLIPKNGDTLIIGFCRIDGGEVQTVTVSRPLSLNGQIFLDCVPIDSVIDGSSILLKRVQELKQSLN